MFYGSTTASARRACGAVAVCILAFTGLPGAALADSARPETVRRQEVAAYGNLPMRFEANLGQSDPRVRFTARGAGYGLFLTATGAVLALDGGPSSGLRMTLANANPAAGIDGEGRLAGTSNYFTGDDPSRWRRNVPGYERVRYDEVYPGVDMV